MLVLLPKVEVAQVIASLAQFGGRHKQRWTLKGVVWYNRRAEKER
jgi:hypothetical protein